MINTGSACNSESLEPSYVLSAMGNPYEFVHGSIRFTLGPESNERQVKHVLKHLPKIVERLRRISPLNLNEDEKKIIQKGVTEGTIILRELLNFGIYYLELDHQTIKILLE